LDGLVGLIPAVGDVATAAVSAYLVYEARQLGVPRRTLAQMGGNVLVDLLLGSVPLIGDIADFGWKANLKNVRLLERHVADDLLKISSRADHRSRGPTRGRAHADRAAAARVND
jgi:hypothetical protein